MNLLQAARYRLGFALRETGQAVERLGATLQGVNSFQEQSERFGGGGRGARRPPARGPPKARWRAPARALRRGARG